MGRVKKGLLRSIYQLVYTDHVIRFDKPPIPKVKTTKIEIGNNLYKLMRFIILGKTNLKKSFVHYRRSKLTMNQLYLHYMKSEDFIFQTTAALKGKTTWTAPSNIALVKYWGKHGKQLPKNPSLSLTLSNCVTKTALDYHPNKVPSDNISFNFNFEGKPRPDFHPKLAAFFQRIKPFAPYIENHHFEISSENSFPHSSGIASSASAMAALSMCLMDIERTIVPEMSLDYFNRKASFLARLGSGSAARSIEGPVTVWGSTAAFSESNDLFAIPFIQDLHPIFGNYQDTILLIDKGSKKVSSTQGHQLMHNHPFANQRFEQGERHLSELKGVMQTGDLTRFIALVESEALTLHAMMMTSNPYFILMHPNTLKVIEKIWEFRETSKIPLCFTLDAGANVHVLYPDENKFLVQDFIKQTLAVFCQNKQFIHDHLGDGVKKH